MSDVAAFEVILKKQPQKALRKLPKDLLQRIENALESLAANPRPKDCKKLVGYDNLYRIREGDWRIVYAIHDDRLIVLVLIIAPRGVAYRNL
jgi:mRNA interferase RelE/StbE